MSVEKGATHVDDVIEPQRKASGELMDLTQGTTQLLDEEGNVRKIPIPTNDPDDPLTWSRWERCLIFAVICVYGISGFGSVQSTALFFGDLIPYYMKETRGTFNPARIGDLASYPSLCMGIGNFIFVPLSLALGRRPVMMFCVAMMVASIVWAAESTTFNSHLGARCLQGLTAGISDCLLPLIVLDITFLHQRGRWMTLYWAVTAIGSSLLLAVVPVLVHNEGSDWRVNYWFWLGFAVLSFILILTCLRETMFDREPALLNGHLIISDAYGQVRFERADQATENSFNEDAAKAPLEKPSMQSRLVKLIPIPYKTDRSHIRTFLTAYEDMLICLSQPAIFWTMVLNAILFAGLVILSLTYSQLLQSPPWLFSAEVVGTAQIGAAFGSVVAFLITGILVEWSAEILDRRSRGMREPEHLLPSFALPCIFGFVGLLIYGIVGGSPTKCSWFGIYAAFAFYYCAFVAISALSSIWVAEMTPKRAGPAIVLICGGRNAASFGISHAFNSWEKAVGFQDLHISLGGIFIGVALFAIPFFFVNKRLRKIWGSFFP